MSISGSIVPARLPAPRREPDLAQAARLDAKHAHTTHRISELSERVVDLLSRRRAVGGAVEHLLSAWRGEEAECFAAGWSAWRDGADVVIDDLRHSVDALHRTHEDLTRADATGNHHTSRSRSRPSGSPA